MKEIKELVFEELSLEQKLGLTMNMVLHGPTDHHEFVFDLIRKRAVGSVWIQQGNENYEKTVAKVREIADYPILILTDAGSGICDFLVGKHNAVGTTGSAKHAYAFGKAVAVNARRIGYNVVCNPVVDMNLGSMRSLGTDKEKVTELAAAMAKGMHDGGVLAVAKHYPGGSSATNVDSHMAESLSLDTEDELLDYALYPYLKLSEEGLIDGIMTRHRRYVNIDDKYPASLSKKVIEIIRKHGYKGFAITDALCMMGIRAKFGDVEAKALALNAGNDILLPYTWKTKDSYDEYLEAYNSGLVSDEALDAAVKRVLEAQHKTLLLPSNAELSDGEIATFRSINKDGIYTRIDSDIPKTISREGKHFFVITVSQDVNLSDGKVDVDTFSGGWHDPQKTVAKIGKLFPNAKYKFIHEFPSQWEMMTSFSDTMECDDLVFITFSEFLAYTGPEHLTRRMESLIGAMQITDRISTLIHLGNPLVLKELPHIKRVIFGGHAQESIETALEVLAGEYPAKGKPTYDFELK